MEITEFQLEKAINNLYNKINYPLNSIYNDKNLFFDYSIIKAANDCSDNLNIFVHNTIKSLFKPPRIIFDTFGSFLFGSHIEYHGEIPKECSPIYLGSLFDNFNHPCCSKQVWIRKNKNSLYKLHSAGYNERTAYLFINDNPISLTDTEKDILKSHGIVEIILMCYENGIYKEYSKIILIEQKKSNTNENVILKKKNSKHKNEIIDNKFNFTTGIFFFLIAIFLVIYLFSLKKTSSILVRNKSKTK